MDGHTLKQAAYESEVKRQRDTYGQDAEIPNDPYSRNLRVGPTLGTPVQPLPTRIADLAKQVSEAGHMLAEARSNHDQSRRHLEKCQAGFAQVSEALLGAIHEHREGTPENVPYGLR